MRNRTPDLLKGIAVILMIQVHLTELFATPDFYESTWGSISLFLGGVPAAPLFMMVMGYYVAQSTKGLQFELVRGIKLIVWGFALNIGLNLNLYYHIYNEEFILNPWEYLFGVDILFLAGVSIMVVGLLKYLIKTNIWGYLTTILLVVLLPEFTEIPKPTGITAYFMAFVYSQAWWSYFPLIPWLAYVLVGFTFNLMEKNMMPFYCKYKSVVLSVSFLIWIFSFNFGFKTATNLPQYYHHGILFFAFALNMVILWTAVAYHITLTTNNLFIKLIEWMGQQVTRIYVFQWLIIGNLATVFYKTQSGLNLLIWYLVILSCSLLATYFWDKLRRKTYKRITI